MRTLRLLSCALALVACGPTSHTPDGGTSDPDSGPISPPPPPGSTATQTIGSAGGSLAIQAFEIEVPPGALASDTEITVTVTSDAVPGAFTGFSPLFRFEPEGLAFAAPVTVRMPFAGDARTATIFWSQSGGTSYVALPTRIEGGAAVAQTTHFSSAFVGTACSGDCCGRANGDLDVLLMVDNSNSMGEEQVSLAVQLPRMARILATGDLDGDGVQDFPALHSLHIGSVTSDMGTAAFTVPTCANSNFGDDGVLRTAGDSRDATCGASYSPFATLGESASASEIDAFVEQVRCTAAAGVGGCGFEQQLEAVLKAVTPASSPTRFFMETTGHADGANAGFVRPSSILATILVTDENDCSLAVADLVNPMSTVYTEDLNLRCFHHPEAQHPVSRYVDGLRALRSDPQDVIFATITGVPVDLSLSDPATILADPRMTEALDPTMPNRLVPSCDVPGRGIAFPPRRILETAQGFGAQAVVGSICQEDFTPLMDAILTRVARRVAGECN
ncbi:MAG: hypothetical protein K8H88_33545 [Sandaracinaceae bacterium]|nr:hypothetical protein [Sandaracinaceae bacterium]